MQYAYTFSTLVAYFMLTTAPDHCRRRKIRCITSPDGQTKCTNCIRLKKDCNFSPVDQQAAAEPRPKIQSRSSVGTRTTSISSPASVTDGNGSVDNTGVQQYTGTTSFSDSMSVPAMQSSSDEGFSRQGDGRVFKLNQVRHNHDTND
jgi:hypothetical protein